VGGDDGNVPRPWYDAGVTRLPLAVLLPVLASLATDPAFGDDDTVPPADADAAIETRLDFLAERFEAGDAGAKAWFWTWTIGYGALALGQGIAYPLFDDREMRANLLVGAASSFLAMAMMLFPPLPAAWAVDDWRDRPEGTDARRRAKLAAGEDLLRDTADAEALGRSWMMHALGGLVAVAGGLVLWLAYDYPIDGAVTFGLDVAATEAQVWTQPTRAIDDRAEYEARFGTGTSTAALRPPSWGFVPFPGGLGVAGAF